MFIEEEKLLFALLRSLSADGKTYLLTAPVTTIGRSLSCDVIIPEMWVERIHAKIIVEYNKDKTIPCLPTYFLQNLSRLGILIFKGDNWQYITKQEQKVYLESGMQLQFGHSDAMVWEFVKYKISS
jgi:FHA domain